MTENIFEAAARNKTRFSYNGLISVEDLWDLSVEKLDSIYGVLNMQLKLLYEDSLLKVKSTETVSLELKIAIVKHIVTEKLAEKERRVHEREQKEKRQQLLEVLANKQNEELLGKSVDEIKQMIASLEG